MQKMKTKTEKWIENVNNGVFKSKVEKVLWAIKQYEKESGKYVDTWYLRNYYKSAIPHQSLTGILTQLSDEGIIEICGEIEVVGNIYSQYRFVSDHETRRKLRIERKTEKYKLWLERASEFEELFATKGTMEHVNYEKNMLKFKISCIVY